MKIKIYSGLSVSKEQVHAILPEAEFSGPVQRHDLKKDIESGVHVIGLIDGVFYRHLAVSPNEILDALRVGIRIFGSSSMGALRAVELSPYGMQGVGKVYEHILKTPYFADEKLGQIFYEGEDFKKNRAAIEIEIGLERAVTMKQLSKAEAKKILELYLQPHFTERSFENLIRSINASHLSQTQKNKYCRVLAGLKNIKHLDGIELLKKIRGLQQSISQIDK